MTGDIWAFTYDPPSSTQTRIAGMTGIVQFALDPATQEILMLNWFTGDLVRLTLAGTTSTEFPPLLSQTGFFADLADLTPNPGVVAYEPNLAFWSDYAIKQRWFALTNLADRFTYDRDAPWTLPPGALWVKHFDLETTRGVPEPRRRIETRVLVRTTNDAYGVSYLWNDAGTEATLAPDAGVQLDVPVFVDATIVTQRVIIPSRAQCMACHGTSAPTRPRTASKPGRVPTSRSTAPIATSREAVRRPEAGTDNPTFAWRRAGSSGASPPTTGATRRTASSPLATPRTASFTTAWP